MPPTKIDDLVAAVVAELMPVKLPHIAQSAIEKGVRGLIRNLQEGVQRRWHRDAVRQLRDDARGVVQTLDEMEHQVQEFLGEASRNKLGDGILRRGFNPVIFRKQVGHLRQACEDIDAALPAQDAVKHACVGVAFMLVSMVSGRKPVNTDNSPFRLISGLLLVATDPARTTEWRNGGDVPDLRRICRAAHTDKTGHKLMAVVMRQGQRLGWPEKLPYLDLAQCSLEDINSRLEQISLETRQLADLHKSTLKKSSDL